MTAKNIWGKVVLFLRDNREVALHVACGDITDIELVGKKFIVNVQDGLMNNILVEGKRELERALRWQGLDLELEINLKQKYMTKEEQDIEKLKKMFGNNIKIK